MNKKILFGLLLIGLLAVQFAPLSVLAEDAVIPGFCTMRADVNGRLMKACPVKKGDVATGTPVGDTRTGKCYYEGETGDTEYYDGVCGICCLLSGVLYATDIIFTGLVALVIVFVLMGAFAIVTAAGAAEKVNKGRDYILYAGIGLGAALLARAVPALVKFILG